MAFRDDHRESNPGLHLLYTKWAVGHLNLIDKCIQELDATSNLNLSGCISALMRERATLVAESAAYADADEIVTIYRTGKSPEPEVGIEVSPE